jgi:hypothetical protein
MPESCLHCGKKLRVPPGLAGKRAKCPGCGEGPDYGLAQVPRRN